MNDVAHPTLVTVKRPITMLPYDFKQAIADLASAGHVDAQLVAGDHAVVEKRELAEVPLEPSTFEAEDEHGASSSPVDAQAGSMVMAVSKVESPRPRASASADRRVVMRAPREGRETSRESAMPPEVGHVVDRVERRERVSSAQTSHENAASAAHKEAEDMPNEINVRELVRTLVAEGVTSTKDLAASPDLAGVGRVAIQNAVTAMKGKGEIVMTGRGEFKKSKTGSGGGKRHAA